MGAYPSVGNVARLSCTFTDETGALADPTTVTVEYKPPGSLTVTATPVRDSVGQYHQDVVLTVPGTWFYRFIGTGTITTETEDMSFYVPGPSF